jgi:hypothetical protein
MKTNKILLAMNYAYVKMVPGSHTALVINPEK